MREIEIKFKIENIESIISFLEKNKCKISKENIQNDTIYVRDTNKVKSIEGSVWLRIRENNNKIELNYKKQSAKSIESEEIEFEVSSYEKANSFLKALGFKEWVQVNKKRKYTKYKDYNICIDEVEKLGTFIEIELLTDKEDKNDYQQELLTIAQELGINPSSRINSHYDTMIAEL